MDNLDLKILEILAQNGRMPYKKIAQQIGISEPTARKRVKEMLDSGKIDIKASVNINEFPEIIVAYIGIKQIGNPHKVLDVISKIPEVVYTVSAIGRYDIIAVLVVNSREKLAKILTDDIVNYENLNLPFTETHVVLYNRNLHIPAENILRAIRD